MEQNSASYHTVYSQPIIEFVTVAAETCLFLEKTEQYDRNSFVVQALRLLSLLYSKTMLLDVPEPVYEESPERFVTEDDYQFVREKVEHILGSDNVYLEVFHPQIQYSDTPIAAFVSEDLADIYQELKDFAVNYRMGVTDIMNDALVMCLEAFAEHWGQKTLNALRALHALRYNENFDEFDENETNDFNHSFDRNTFFANMRDDEL